MLSPQSVGSSFIRCDRLSVHPSAVLRRKKPLGGKRCWTRLDSKTLKSGRRNTFLFRIVHLGSLSVFMSAPRSPASRRPGASPKSAPSQSPPPVKATSLPNLRDHLKVLLTLVESSHLAAAARSEISAKIRAIDELVCQRPLTLADVAAAATLKEAAVTEADSFGVDEQFLAVQRDFEPDEREHLVRLWREMLWLARHDMSSDELLLLTDVTFEKLAEEYRHSSPKDVKRYWLYLVRLRKEQRAIQAACGKVDSPKERNAGEVVASRAKASQRTEALPGGVSSGEYKPEVYSPTAALWMSPSQRAASTRAPSERAKSQGAGSLKSPSRKSPSSPPRLAADGSPAATTAGGKLRPGSGNLSLTTSGEGFKGTGPAFTQKQGWCRF